MEEVINEPEIQNLSKNENIELLKKRIQELENENSKLKESLNNKNELLKEIFAIIDESNVAYGFLGEKAEKALNLFTMRDPNAVIDWKKGTGTSPAHLRDYWCPCLRNCYSFSPLHIAAIKATESNYKCFRQLLLLATKTKNDINIRDIMGRTPLFYAARYGNLFTVKKLIEEKASVRILDYTGLDAIQFTKGSVSMSSNKDIQQRKEEILYCLEKASKEEKTDDAIIDMNNRILEVHREFSIPETARTLSNCVWTITKRFFVLYCERKMTEKGMILVNPEYNIEEIKTVSECKFPHYQLFKDDKVLLLAYELTKDAVAEEDIVACYNKALAETTCTFHQYTNTNNPHYKKLAFFYKNPFDCSGDCALHMLQQLVERLNNTRITYIYDSSQSGTQVRIRENDQGQIESYVHYSIYPECVESGIKPDNS